MGNYIRSLFSSSEQNMVPIPQTTKTTTTNAHATSSRNRRSNVRVDTCLCGVIPTMHGIDVHLDPRMKDYYARYRIQEQSNLNQTIVSAISKGEDLNEDDSLEKSDNCECDEDDDSESTEQYEDCNCSLSRLNGHARREHCTKCGKFRCSCAPANLDIAATTREEFEEEESDKWCLCAASNKGCYGSHCVWEHCSICGGLEQTSQSVGLCYECNMNHTSIGDY